MTRQDVYRILIENCFIRGNIGAEKAKEYKRAKILIIGNKTKDKAERESIIDYIVDYLCIPRKIWK